MKTFKEFIEEATKEMTLKQVMKKINDGYWEAEQDMKVGRHAILRDLKTKKRITVYIKEDLDESSASLIVSAVKKDIGLTEKKFKIAHLTGNVESPKNNDKCVIVFKDNGKPKFKVYTFDSSNKWVPGAIFADSSKLKSLWKDFPNVDYNLNEATQEKDLDPKKKIVVKGVKGMKSKPFTKKFKNADAYEKWTDSDEFGDFEVHQIMNESEEDNYINEAETDPYNFISDLIMDFEKKLSIFTPIIKKLDPEVIKDLKKLEAECTRVRKGKLHDVRPGR